MAPSPAPGPAGDRYAPVGSTHGAPNRGRLWQPAPIVKAVTELSRPDLPVHTIGVGEAAFDLLRQIAAATGGTFLDAFE